MPIVNNEIKNLLKDQKLQEVENYIGYLNTAYMQKDREKNYINQSWMDRISSEKYAFYFKKIANEGLVFDGKHITLTSRGISLDYVAYKNKMLLVYPESQISFGIVYKDDDFKIKTDNGKVIFRHELNDPFNKNEQDIIGAYCVIRNNRGEAYKVMDKTEIEKHRKVASTDMMWKAWLEDMIIKTVLKKACKVYFDDIVEGIDDIDNQDIDLTLPVDGNLEFKKRIEAAKDLTELAEIQEEFKPTGSDLAYVTKRFQELNDAGI